MSDDSKDSPPIKLTLSRHLKTQAEPNSAPVEAPPVIKLKRTVETSQVSESTPPNESSTHEVSPAPHPPVATPPEPKPAFDLKKPFGDKIKSSEIKEPNSLPPPDLPVNAKPILDDNSGAMVEEAINSLNTAEAQNASKNSILPSVIIILILLIVLGAAGFGLWKVLQASDGSVGTKEVAASNESEQSAPNAQNAPKNPIEIAKKTIAQVPVSDVDAIVGMDESATQTTATISNTMASATEPGLAVSTETEPTPTQRSSSIEADKQAVSEYLSSVHIGGLRKGDRPMIILGGERFDVGDVVQAKTGLTFDGLRDGRLAFRDQNGIVYLKSF